MCTLIEVCIDGDGLNATVMCATCKYVCVYIGTVSLMTLSAFYCIVTSVFGGVVGHSDELGRVLQPKQRIDFPERVYLMLRPSGEVMGVGYRYIP